MPTKTSQCCSGQKLYFLAPLVVFICAAVSCGCWAPYRSPGINASSLPEDFRAPQRTVGPALNLANLTVQPPQDYRLGPDDLLEVTVPGLYDGAEVSPLRVRVMASGDIQLPMVGTVCLGGMNLLEAQKAITDAYANDFLRDPKIHVVLAEKATVSVLVLGQVNTPGIHLLPRYQNDVGHALAAAGGLTIDSDSFVEIHRRTSELAGTETLERLPPVDRIGATGHPAVGSVIGTQGSLSPNVKRISFLGTGGDPFGPSDIVLSKGDVVVVPNRRYQVFYVVGRLSTSNTVRFRIGDRERELGVGFVLPREREIDVVEAVTMAGYIDPIESPTTVTVHRRLPDGSPMLINVDLIKARYSRCETVLVQPGDIIYLNPDAAWWWRRTFDRIIPTVLTSPYTESMGRWLNPRNNN